MPYLSVIDEALQSIESGQIEEGLQHLEEIRQKAGHMEDVQIRLAHVYLQLGHLEKVNEIISPLLENEASVLHHEAQLIACEMWMENGQIEQAMETLVMMKENGYEEARIDVLLADVYAMLNLPEVAVKYLQQAYEKEPEMKEIESALQHLAVENHMNSPIFDDHIMVPSQMESIPDESLSQTAKRLAKAGRFEEALQKYAQVLKDDPTPDDRFGYGMVAYQLKKWDVARQALEQLLKEDPDYLSAYSILANIYIKIGEIKKAKDILKYYVQLNPEDEKSVYRLAKLYFDDEEYEKAKDLILQDGEEEDNPEALYLLGNIFEAENRPEKALDYYQRCIVMSPEWTEVKEKILQLRK